MIFIIYFVKEFQNSLLDKMKKRPNSEEFLFIHSEMCAVGVKMNSDSKCMPVC